MKNKFSNEVLISILYAIFIIPIFLLFSFGIIKSSATLHAIQRILSKFEKKSTKNKLIQTTFQRKQIKVNK